MSGLTKKILVCALGLMMALILFGCSGDAKTAPTAEPTQAASDPTEAPTEEPAATNEPADDNGNGGNTSSTDFQSEIVSNKAYNLPLYGEDIVNPDAVHEIIKWDGKERPMGETETCAWQFIATTTVTQMDISTATFENEDVSVTLTIYEWKGDYEDSIMSTPILTETKTGIKDNQSIRFRFKDYPLPAGEYLCVISQPSTSFTIWVVPYTGEGVESPYVRFYTNGKITTGVIPQVKIRYADTPAVVQMEISQ